MILGNGNLEHAWYWGHPLAGSSRGTNVPRKKEDCSFPFFPSRTVRDLSVTRPCFLFIRCLPVPSRQVGRWFAPITHQDENG